MKRQRAFEHVETKVRDRLNELHTLPNDAPAQEGQEASMLEALLRDVRAEAERQVDAGSRPSTARSAVGVVPLQ